MNVRLFPRDFTIGVVSSIVATGVLAGFSLLPLSWALAVGLGLLAVVEAYLLWAYRDRSNSPAVMAVGIESIRDNAEPVESIVPEAVRSIDFWGISAKRTFSNPRMRQAMVRVARDGGEVRILLLKASSEHLKKRAEDERESADAWKSDIRGTYERLKQLAASENLRIAVRFYDQYPVWRMLIVDRRRVYVNWFLPDKQGPESPQLILASAVEAGLAKPLLRSFDECWKASDDTPD